METPPSPPVHNNVVLTVKDPAHVATVADLLKEQASLAREEPGCLRFEVHHDTTDPRMFLLLESWESAAHLAAHRQAPAFVALYQPRVLPLVERTPYVCARIA